MANLYWVGGTGDWSEFWVNFSTTSGGSPNRYEPLTSSDNLIIDENSGFGSGGTITLDESPQINDLTCTTGHTFTITAGGSYAQPLINGNLTLEAGLTIDLYFILLDGTGSITSNGATIGGTANYGNIWVRGSYTLLDNITLPGLLKNTGTLSLGANTIQTPLFNNENTIVCGTSTIKIVGSGSGAVGFYGGNQTYYNLWLTGTGTSDFTIYGSNTFNEIKIDTNTHKVVFYAGTTQTVSTFDVNGTTGNLIEIDAPVAGSVSSITINNAGYNYEVDDVLTLSQDFSGNDCTITVDSITSESLGSEEVSNGTFTGDATGWTLNGNWAYGTNNLVHTGEDNEAASQYLDVSEGTYKITLDAVVTSGSFSVSFGGSGFNVDTTGSYSQYVLVSSAMDFTIYDNGFVGSIDNISVKKATTTDGGIDTYTITDTGTGYTTGQKSITGGSGQNASISVATITQQQFTLSKSSGTVECEYLDISNSNATGGATWIATNSIDSGNNTGWQFPVNTTLTSIDAGTTTILTPTITGDANSDLTLINVGSVVALAPTVTGDANTTLTLIEAGSVTVTTPTITEGLGVDTTLDLVEAGSVTIPEITVGIGMRVFLEALALSTSLYEPTISVERNWGQQGEQETTWTPANTVTTTWTPVSNNNTTWTPVVDTLKQS